MDVNKLMINRRILSTVMLCSPVLLHFNSYTVFDTFMAKVARQSSYNVPLFREEAMI